MKEEFDFKYSEARILPVVLLLDASGSMDANGRIGVLNEAVREMLQSFASNSDNHIAIHVAVVKFGGTAGVEYPMVSAAELMETYNDLQAGGGTPLGAALTKAKQEIIERKDVITSRSYRPTVVLVSDGMPNDEWERPLEQFIKEGRSSKCYRVAMGIGVQKGTREYAVLEKFADESEKVVSADQANQIKNFFRYVTISTIARTKSSNPNIVTSAALNVDDDDDDDNLF